MFQSIYNSFKNGFRGLRRSPQLVYTILIALVVVGAFLYTANTFLQIAQSAQDRLISTETGSMQSVLAEFTPAYFDKPLELEQSIQNIAENNTTIKDFRVIKKEGDAYTIIASLNKDEIGTSDDTNSFLYGIANVDPTNSFTNEQVVNGDHSFVTVRALTNASSTVIGTIMTRQSLSQADQTIQDNIRQSLIILLVVLVFLMFLFFRHSRIVDYVTLYKKLKDVDNLKDDFISMASHELRTPLTVIRGYAEFVGDSKNLSEEDKDNVEHIQIASKQLSNMVTDMLDVSRIEQGRMSFTMEEFDPKDFIAKIVDSFTIPAKDAGLTLLFDAKESTIISADKDRLRQVVVNLIGNSIKYTKEGSITVRLSKNEKGNCEVRVIDTGLGMSAEAQKNLFQKFYRIKTKDTKTVTGTGLGLWITKQIVEAMGGNISVESIEGVGSHFIVTFPVVK